MLIDTLAKNFLAQRVSAICAVDNKNFINETSGALGDASSYAERVKQEVVSGLPLNEEASIIGEAATQAKAEALQVIRSLSVDGQIDPARLDGWCKTVGKPFIQKLERIYDMRHSDFERELNNAKH